MKLLTTFLALGSVASFAPQPSLLKGSPKAHPHPHGRVLFAETTTTTTFSIEKVEGDDRVLDVATFRNNMVNPQMMVDRAQAKQDAIDTTQAALDGLKIGLLYVGPAVAAATYLETGDPMQAGANYAMLGGGIGALLGANNYMGKGIHVPDVPEATNRIIVDFSEGLLRNQDVGFVAISDDDMFAPAHGVMAAVDVQLRNSDKSHPGARQVANLPAHFHIKNMEVHKLMRRQGVGQALLDALEEYSATQTDAKAFTLEVEAANPAAVNLYRKTGFEERPNPNKLSKNLYMVKML